MAGAQRYQHHQQYLYPSGFFQQGILCQCHRQHFPGEHKGMICNKNKAARNLKKSGLLVWCRWWDSNPHGFPSDFESLVSAIPPHRLIWIWMRFARFFGSWRDVQEGCWNLSTANRSKTFVASLKFQMGARSREADFESPSSAIPTHRLMFRTLFIIPDSLPKIKTKNQKGNLPPAACFFSAGRWTEPTPGGILGADVLHHRRV